MAIGETSHFVRVYDDNLAPDMCQRFLASFAALARFQVNNGRGKRAGLEESAWTELNVTSLADAAFMNDFRLRMDAALEHYNRDVSLTIPVPRATKHSDLVLKRYRPGQQERFQLHFDSIYSVCNRYLVMLWYLNDVADGGETVFPQLGLSIRPAAGRLLVFPPYWMYQHEGIAPRSGEKYILSCYLLFGETPSTATTAA